MSPAFRFSVDAPPDPLPPDADDTFFWSGKGVSPWFASNVGPEVCEFGIVVEQNVDFVRIASAVLAADRSTSRSGRLSRWNQREISVSVEVNAAKPWLGVRDKLESLLAFLTGDVWHLDFVKGGGASEQLGTRATGAVRVVLLSGGADSAAGALISALKLGNNETHALLSHWASPTLPRLQRELVSEISRLAPGSLSDHVQVRHSRGGSSPTGKNYKKEDSTRSRSLLFIAFGLALASVEKVPLWIPENGFASVNPPLASNRRGSLSTKTTHPAFLQNLRMILDEVGAHADFVNPFSNMTKGEMLAKVRDAIGPEDAADFLSMTTSCSHTGARSYGISSKTSCGVCFGCVLRKASFHAANVEDHTTYVSAGDDKRVAAWLEGKTVVPAMRDFLASRFGEADLVALRIPRDVPLADVADLCKRSMDELRGLGL